MKFIECTKLMQCTLQSSTSFFHLESNVISSGRKFSISSREIRNKTKPRYAQRTKILLPLSAILVDMGIFTLTKLKSCIPKSSYSQLLCCQCISSALLAQDSESASNSDDRNLLTEIYDGTYTVSNEIFEAKLVGVYMDDYPELYKDGYYSSSTILRNYYNVDQFAVFQQLPTEVYWSVQETDKNNKDWTRENTFTYPEQRLRHGLRLNF